MTHRLLGSSSLIAIALVAVPAFADNVQETFTGTVSEDTDANGVFGPSGAHDNLIGDSYTATYVFDTSIGTNSGPPGNFNFDDGGAEFGVASPLTSASVTVNGLTMAVSGAWIGLISGRSSTFYRQNAIAQSTSSNDTLLDNSITNYNGALPTSINQSFSYTVGPGDDATGFFQIAASDEFVEANLTSMSMEVNGNEPINCFLKGTRIKTSRGEVEIEKLTVDDVVVTVHGERKRIERIQRQVVEPSLGHLPIRIARGALGDAAPRRDLYLSPAHCLYIDGVLIPADHLVNNCTITLELPEDVGEIDYYHIELETHEVIFAEGAQAETLLVDGMTRCAPYFARNGGRSEFRAMLRRLATPVIDVRDPIQVAYDRIAARATSADWGAR